MPRAGVPIHNCVPWIVFWSACAAMLNAHSKAAGKASPPDMSLNIKPVDYVASAVCFVAAFGAVIFPGDTLVVYYPRHAKASAHAEVAFFITGTSLLQASAMLCTTSVKPGANTVKKIFFGLTAAFMAYSQAYEGVYQQLAFFLSVALTAFYTSPSAFF